MNIIQKYTYRINSQQGTQLTSGLTTNTNFPISQIVNLISVGGMFQMRCHGITIPFSFYQMSSDINTLTCIFTDASGNTKTSTITLTAGNYTCSSILTELQTRLIATAAISSGSYVGLTLGCSFSYNSATGKSTLAITNAAPVSVQINFASNLNAGLFFGFSTNQTVSLANPRTSTQVAVANPVSYLLLRCSNLKQFNNREFITSPDIFSDVIYRIPIVTNQGTWIQYLLPSEPVFIANNSITNYTFYLTTNLTSLPIDLQGLYYSFQFTIEEVAHPKYESINAVRFTNQTTLGEDKDLQELIRQRDAEIERLKVYQKKLQEEPKRKTLEEALADVEQGMVGGTRGDFIQPAPAGGNVF